MIKIDLQLLGGRGAALNNGKHIKVIFNFNDGSPNIEYLRHKGKIYSQTSARNTEVPAKSLREVERKIKAKFPDAKAQYLTFEDIVKQVEKRKNKPDYEGGYYDGPNGEHLVSSNRPTQKKKYGVPRSHIKRQRK